MKNITHKFKLLILKSKLMEFQVKHRIEQGSILNRLREQMQLIQGKIKDSNRICMII
jgi:hypothetical protein